MSNVVTLLLGGKKFSYWETMTLNSTIDSMDTISFGSLYEQKDINFRNTFRPMSFLPMDVAIDDQQHFKGTLLTPNPQMTERSSRVSVSGYALPGVLNECPVPPTSYPLEYRRLNLKQIAERIANPFQVAVQFDGDPGATFRRVAIKPPQKPLAFLTSIAQQRNFIMSNTPDGKLLFPAIVTEGSPVARLKQGESPLTSIEPAFKPQAYFSEITGIKPAKVGSRGAKYTLKNPLLFGVFRPFTFQVPNARGADLKTAVASKMGLMFGNAVGYTANLATWRTPGGDLWKPNTTVKVLAPNAMINNEYEFLIKSVSLKKTERSETATLGLTLPGAFAGIIPRGMPWDE